MAADNAKHHADTTRAHLRVMEELRNEDGTPILDGDGNPVTIDVGYAVPDDKLTDLELVEREHGFVFGVPSDHESAGAPRSMAVSCSNPNCDQVNRQVELHADTVVPVACGGCGSILYCDHVDTLTSTHHEGDLANPRRITTERCVVCQTVINRAEEKLPPIKVKNIPLHLFAGLDIDAIAKAATE